MSVIMIIKGMKKPETCNNCQFVWDSLATCSLTYGDIEGYYFYGPETNPPDWCPLVEVPTPHGRLIDADAMLVDESEAYMTAQLSLMGAGGSADATRMINEVVHKKMQMLIADTPTVIEAEE